MSNQIEWRVSKHDGESMLTALYKNKRDQAVSHSVLLGVRDAVTCEKIKDAAEVIQADKDHYDAQ